MIKIYPSLISANLLNLEKEIKILEPYCAGFHLDVMDFHFVPNLTWGPDFINTIRTVTDKQIWVHLMVESPSKYFDRLKLKKNDILTIHLENGNRNEIIDMLTDIKSRSWIPSLSIKPKTSVDALVPFFDYVEQMLIMSVEPGFSGQTFISESISRLSALTALKNKHHKSFRIGIDGGINNHNIADTVKHGAQDIAAATAIFGQSDPIKALNQLNNAISHLF